MPTKSPLDELVALLEKYYTGDLDAEAVIAQISLVTHNWYAWSRPQVTG